MDPEPSAAAPRRRLPAVAGPLAVGAIGLAAAALVHVVDPNEAGNYPTCPWLMVTGTYCPGCGTMRAVSALTNGDLAGAFAMNPLTMVLLPILAVGWARWLYASLRPGPDPFDSVRPVWLWLLLGVVLAFWLVRNLPFGAFLAPGS
ncbi:uncharacterized protein DUF2752 [Murinocardiopsis flavida]|uniref:Uncharacterized protein DUF2752 n=1 Tax=Murinocardiopsis flavida TaxID=645275 RepID=A0A2P8CNM0_9ACTN|nr:DUF2752 domain-containing protein [Murinocardiopsis flavida]PSK86553.1 uncharacterized protein DUF2752 [Murinocardiopsis flavida]